MSCGRAKFAHAGLDGYTFCFYIPYIIFQKELHIILNHIYGRDVEYLEKTNLAPYLATSPVGSDRQARQSV